MLGTELRKSRTAAIPHQGLPAKKNTTKDTRILVTIAGLEPKVGATHLALSLALKASEQGKSCGIILPEKNFDSMKECYVLSVREETAAGQRRRQFASFAGISIMSGVLPGDLEGFQLLIWDCGVLSEGARRFASGDLRCIVSGGQAWELAPLNALLLSTSYEDLRGLAVCIRGVSQDDFNHIHKQMAGKIPCVFVQHKPTWNDISLREDLVALLRLAGC
ncbi:MAG: hypothetical protein FWD93_02840 [Coriobacteriia bacterium]|nr:hypothetical protein [Coriobacteriia bacterium]